MRKTTQVSVGTVGVTAEIQTKLLRSRSKTHNLLRWFAQWESISFDGCRQTRG